MNDPAETELPKISQAMLRDQFRLRRQQKQIKNATEDSSEFQKWHAALQKSVKLRSNRQASLPDAPLDNDLPIAQRAEEIQAALRDHQVIVVSGETGSGKSTQLPLICLQMGYGVAGFIGHTQPRRIAARGVSARIAEQLSSKLGETVGYKVRFGDQTSPQTLVKVMTDGILLAETGSDRFLEGYEVLIIDEAHERSLNIDFLLGYIKRLLPKRPNLKLIITSATIDTQKFADHFTIDLDNPVPIINVEGRTYPVDIEYRPVGFDDQGNPVDQDLETATVQAIAELAGRDRGDMLVFLPTEQAIRSVAKKLRSRSLPGDGAQRTEILPLYARLSTDQQNTIFKPGSARRVVLATNVAESSITVPRIRYVVDQGLARISRYAPRSKVQRLPIESISQASADQRAGRCGRLGPGICIRLYSEDDFNQRARFTTPEIKRTNLASVILQTKALKLGDIEEFPFIESPSLESIRDGFRTLHEIGAVDHRRDLTSLGKQLSRLPVDPRIGRMLFAGHENGCLADILVIAAGLEIQDPRVRPVERQAEADAAHQPFHHGESDFIGKLILWQWLQDRKETLSRSKFRRACAQNYLSYMLVQQWMDIHRQLKSMVREHKLHWSQREADPDYAAIHQSLLTGFLSGVALQTDRREYTGQGGIKFFLWPGSGVVKHAQEQQNQKQKKDSKDENNTRPKWILVAEIVETAKRYGRTIAKIDPTWIEPLAEHLVKHSYSEPHWSKKRQSAMAYEKVSLFGLPIVARRLMRYGNVDPDHSRQLLIEKGLVEFEMKRIPPFLTHNMQVLDEIKTLAAKTRQREWVVDAYRIRNWYDHRLPESIFDGGELSGALKKDAALDERLRFTIDELMQDSDLELNQEDFPNEIKIGDMTLPVEYKFTPGTEDDGVNVRIPIEGVSQVHDNHLGWSVPGLLQPRIIALIRSLPKAIRRNLVPAPETAEQIAGRIEFGNGAFWEVMARELSKEAGERITIEMFNRDKINDSQKLNVQVCDDDGKVIAQARSLQELRAQLPQPSELQAIAVQDDTVGQEWHQDGLTDWTWDELPKKIVVQRGVADVPLFPTIVAQDDSVQLRLFDNRERSNQISRNGITTLYRIANRKPIKSQVNWLPDLDKAGLVASQFLRSSKELKPALTHLITAVAFVDGRKMIRTRTEFELRQSNAIERISVATQKIATWLQQLTQRYQDCVVRLDSLGQRYQYAKTDVQRQFQHLFVSDFLTQVPWAWLEHYPRFLQAVLSRLEKLGSGSADKDALQTDELSQWYDRFEHALEVATQLGTVDMELDHFGWLLQEYRVSLFDQKLGTSETVSPQRLEKQWRKVTVGG